MKKLRKLLALLLACLMVLSLVPAAAAVTPPDMPSEGHWAYAALQAAVENGLLLGDETGHLNPTGSLTRAEMATVVNRAFGATALADIAAFTDVPADAWYAEEIAKAVAMGTFAGDGNGKMRPNDSVSRQEAFAVMARAFKLEGDDLSALDVFSDAGTISSWAKVPLANMAKADYIHGSAGKLNPLEPISRQEFAQVMFNMIKTYADASTTQTVGNVLVSVGGTTLQNLVIDGDLIITEGVGDSVITLDNVTVTGRIVVRSDVTLELADGSTVNGDILVYANDAAINADEDSSFTNAVINGDNAEVSASSGTVTVAPDASGTRVNGEPAESGETIVIDIPDPLLLALTAVNAATYSTDSPLVDEAAAIAAVKAIADAAINNPDILVSVQVISYAAAVAGTLENPNGTNGALTFTLSLTDGGSPAVSNEFSLVLPAAVYSVEPSVAVTPESASIAYEGDVTLTATATDILNITYQWYCAATAESAGEAMEGKTESTLALTDLTETAYYFCMCGETKSNVVKVTVAENPLKAALTAVNAITYAAAQQASCADQAAAVAYVKGIVENAIDDTDVLVTVNATSYTAPVAGTLSKLSGTDGSLAFTVSLEKAGITETVAEKTLTITATPYVPQPSVAVTPESADLAYEGDVTLTAVATDILNPTYQWYCAAAADADGEAMTGETADTLALTDLIETAYYYCKSGEVKSNVVTVTVAENPLKAALAAVNAITYAAAQQASCLDQAAAVAYVKSIVENAIDDTDVVVTANAISYTAPVAGTLADLDGTNGSMVFTVSLEKAGITETVAEKTLTITATPYVPQPSVAVTPADPSVAYKGSSTLTAVATDILNPTYQWYCAAAADADGEAMTGETADTLVLTDLIETAYYFCKSGETKSNVVKVTVAAHPLAAALAAVNNLTYAAVKQADYADRAAAVALVKSLAETAVNDDTIAISVSVASYNAPVAGTLAKPSGTNGSLVFTIGLAKSSYTETADEKTLTITATPYVPQPSVAVTPADPSVAYKGSSTLTAVATDILNPTYQWYCAAAADADGEAMTGETADTLVLTDLIETAYYFCKSGTVKSNVVKVTVAENPLKAALAAVNAITYTAAQQASCADRTATVAYVKGIVENAIDDIAVIVTVNVTSYIAPAAGTLSDLDGTNGSMVFTVSLEKAGITETVAEKTLTITATVYVPQPSVAVTPASASIAYEGDVTLTAAATDILNPTYQWYRTTSLSGNGTELAGKTAATLALTDLTETAYYYCMCGETMSNVVKVTVAENPLKNALAAVNAITYAAAQQASCLDQAAAVAYVKGIVENAIDDTDVAVTVNVTSYAAPVAGKFTDLDGTDGSMVFAVSLEKAGITETVAKKTLTITATVYVPQPSVAVTPASASIAYEGDVTLTAAATDILNPTYQWYCADAADADGEAMEGKTAKTLALTDLTATAYYYCKSGETKSNVVKVTVAAHPLAAALAAVNARVFQLIAQEDLPTQADAVNYVRADAEHRIGDASVTVTVNVISYSAPTAGTFTDLDGKNGSLVFTYGLAKGGYTKTSVEKALPIGATVYIQMPKVTVTPASASVAYQGDVTLTAATFDILNPTYQWYCAEAAESDDVAMEGETANTLALTDLTETAYYYCKCGVVRSNVVKVTVGENPLADALAAVNNLFPEAVGQSNCANQAAALTLAKNAVVAAVNDASVTVTLNVISYSAPIAGTLEKRFGTDGSLVFTVGLAKDGCTETSGARTQVIIATYYVAHPSVTVTPESADLAYGGDVTLTAVTFDILNPTYQWYCAAAANAEGTAMTGKTSATLSLTDLTETAYYYCKSGATKSNVVKVTVAAHPLAESLSIVNSVIFPAVVQTRTPSQSAAIEFAEGLLQFVISDSAVTSTLNFVSYTAPVAGTLDDLDGTNGNLVFTYDLTKDGYTETTVEKTLTILATSYVPQPSVAVTPESADLAYEGDVTLTAAATDILNPTYQWYCAATVNAAGTAMTGKTTATLSLTDLTATAYYYCMCGETKSNVVKVTVAAHPLAAALAVVNALTIARVAQNDYPDEAAVTAYVKALVEEAVDDDTVTVTVNKDFYQAPVAGTFQSSSGMTGLFRFAIGLAKSGYTQTSAKKDLFIDATVYVANPSVSVAPLELSINYKGSAEFNASFVDIYNPVTQWYRTDSPDEEGVAVPGGTHKKLILDKQTESGYYYCIIGGYKTAVVKLTVDENPLKDALVAFNALTFPPVKQADCTVPGPYVRNMVTNAVNDSDVIVMFYPDPSYTAPIAGTLEDPDGTDGTIVFSFMLQKSYATEFTEAKTMTITATPYVARPSVAVTPTAPSLLYAGSTTLTANATDILNPTYQWYCAEAAESDGVAMEGETASTLTLTELTETAYYYCKCGETKSNVVTVTVATPPLQVSGTIYTDLSEALAAAGSQNPVMVIGDYTVAEGTTVTIGENQLVIVEADAFLRNNGTIENHGRIELAVKSAFTNNGTVNGVWHQDEHSDNPEDIWYDSSITARAATVQNNGQINDRLERRDIYSGSTGGVNAIQYTRYSGSGTVAESQRIAEVDSDSALRFVRQQWNENSYNLIILTPKTADTTVTLTQNLIVRDCTLLVHGKLVVPNTVTITVESGSELNLDDAEVTLEGNLRLDNSATLRMQQSMLNIHSSGILTNNGFVEVRDGAHIVNGNIFENNSAIFGEATLDDTSTDGPFMGNLPSGNGDAEAYGYVKTAAAFRAVADSDYFSSLWITPLLDDADLPGSTDADRTLTLSPDYPGESLHVKPALLVGVVAQNGQGQRYASILCIEEGLNFYPEGGLSVSGKLINNGILNLTADAETEAKHSAEQLMGTVINNGSITLAADKRLDCRGDLINNGSFTNNGSVSTYLPIGTGYPQYGTISGNPIEGDCAAYTVVYSQEDFEEALSQFDMKDIVLGTANMTYVFPTDVSLYRGVSIGAAPDSNITLDLSGVNLTDDLTLFNCNVSFTHNATLGAEVLMLSCNIENTATLVIAESGSLSLGAYCEFFNHGTVENHGHFHLNGTAGYCRFNFDLDAHVENYGTIYSDNAGFNVPDWTVNYYEAESASYGFIRNVNRADLARELVNFLGDRLDPLQVPTSADFEAYAQDFADWEFFFNDPDDRWDDDTQGEYAIALLLKNGLITPVSSGRIGQYEHISRLETAQLLDALAQLLGMETLLVDSSYAELTLTDTEDLSALELVRAGVLLPVSEGIFDGESILEEVNDASGDSLWDMLEAYCDALNMGGTAHVSTVDELQVVLDRSYVEYIYLDADITVDEDGAPLVLRAAGNLYRQIHVPAGVSVTVPEGETLRIERGVDLLLESEDGSYGMLYVNGTLDSLGGVMTDGGEQMIFGPNGKHIFYPDLIEFAWQSLSLIKNRLPAPTAAEVSEYAQILNWPVWDAECEEALAYFVKYGLVTQSYNELGEPYWDIYHLISLADALNSYERLYRAIYEDDSLMLPESVSLTQTNPPYFFDALNNDMHQELQEKFAAVLPLVDDNTTTTVTITEMRPEYNGVRFLQPVTLTCEDPYGGGWGGEAYFKNCEFAGGLTVVEEPGMVYAVELSNSCSGEITVVPYEGQDLRGGDCVELRLPDGCIVNATAPMDVTQNKSACFTLNGTTFDVQCATDYADNWASVSLRYECNGVHNDAFWEGEHDHSGCLLEDGVTPAEGIMRLESRVDRHASVITRGDLSCKYFVSGTADLSGLNANGHEIILTDWESTSEVNIGTNAVSIYDAAGGGYRPTGTGTVTVYNNQASIVLGETALSEPHIFGSSEDFGVYIPSGNTDLEFILEQGQWAGEGVPVTEWSELIYALDTANADTENKLHLIQSGGNAWITDPDQVRLSVMLEGYPTIVYDRVQHKPEIIVGQPSAYVKDGQLRVTGNIEFYSMDNEENLKVYIRLNNGSEWVQCGSVAAQAFKNDGALLTLPPAGEYSAVYIYVAYADEPNNILGENTTNAVISIP